MRKLYQVVLLCYVSLIVFILIDMGDAEDRVHVRQKRYLSFRNMSHFFIRLNFKANMVPWNQIFAQAVGFRMNWDEPPDSFHTYHHIARRTIYSHLETLLDRNGLSGFHCIRRAICEMRMIPEPQGIYHKILKIVFRRQSSSTDKWHNITTEECEDTSTLCPLSLLEVSLFTDL